MSTAITSLPYTIGLPGVYYLDIDSSNVYYDGTPITIEANDVCLDMNQCSVINASNPATTQNKGIKIQSNFTNVKVRNGTLRGFFYGVHFEDNTYLRSVYIENMIIQMSSFRGIVATGKYNHIKNCIIEGVSGTSVYSNPFAMGIECTGQAIIENNKIFEVYGTGTGEGVPISSTDQGYTTIIKDNLISNRVLNNHVYGIWVGGTSEAYCLNNTIINSQYGISYSSPTKGGYKDNLLIGCGLNYNVHSGIIAL